MRLAFAAAFAALAATPVVAQEATPQQIAVARAQADRLIADANAGAWFENITGGAQPEVRHRPSGMRCLFSGSSGDQIVVYPASPRIPQGDDVGCNVDDEALGINLTLYATRYNPLLTEAQALAGTENAILQRVPDARPYAGDLTIASVEGRPVPRAGAWTLSGGRVFTMALVSHSRTWGFKARATGEDATTTSLVAGIVLISALQDTQDWPAAD